MTHRSGKYDTMKDSACDGTRSSPLLCTSDGDACLHARMPQVTSAAAAAAAGRVAIIDYHLGVIALAVEENSAAQEALDKCAVSFTATVAQ